MVRLWDLIFKQTKSGEDYKYVVKCRVRYRVRYRAHIHYIPCIQTTSDQRNPRHLGNTNIIVPSRAIGGWL